MEIDANEVIQKLVQDLGQLHLQLAIARVQVEKLLAEKTASQVSKEQEGA